MKEFSKSKAFQLLSLILLLVISCTSNDDPIIEDQQQDNTPVSIVIVAQNSYSGMLNDTFQLAAEVRNSDGDLLLNHVVSWASDDTSKATISSTGLLRILRDGSVTITASVGNLDGTKAIGVSITSGNLLEFTVDGLSAELQAQGGSSFLFLNETSLSGTFYELGVGETTPTTTPDKDRVYYLFEGSLEMTIGGQVVTVEEESAVFVQAGISRNISSVSSNARIIVTEMKLSLSTTQLPFRMFTRAQMVAPRNPNSNVWNPFLNEESVTFGMYMLPQVVGGDTRLVHGFDELNIITRGASRFETDDGEVQVSSGSIVYVREGNGHAFNMLESDIDILILWSF